MEKRCSTDGVETQHRAFIHRYLSERPFLWSAISVTVVVGTLAIGVLIVLLGIFFRKAMFILAIPAMVTLLSAGAIFRRDHRFVWPLIGISFFHLFLTIHLTLIFLFYFFFKHIYILMVFNWLFNTSSGTRNVDYYFKCGCILLGLTLFFVYNLWQLIVALNFQGYLRLSDPTENTNVFSGSTESSVALNYSQRTTPSPPSQPKRSVGGTSAIIFVNGIADGNPSEFA